jgi:serine/threonine-protein kinase
VSVSRGLDTVTVPDLFGATVDEAQALLSERTLGTVTVEEEVFSDTVERGLILSHDPPLDRTVDQLTDVGVVVSKGIEQIEVPEVTGLTLENAETVVTDAKLVLEATTEYSDEVPTAGEIISQSVATGSRLDKGSTLAVVVSKGPLTLPLPDVRTKSLKDAVSQLQALDLVVDVDENPLPTIGPFTRGVPGRAEETVPQAGKTVARGDRVLIYTFIGN